MNIFYLDSHPHIAATYHNNKHVVKMILESAQLLSTTHQVVGSNNPLFYKPTHVNHPSAIWTRASKENYRWLHALLTELCKEYTFRYGKVHKVESSGLLNALTVVPQALPNRPFFPPTPAMPEKYIIDSSVCESYRQYYREAKCHMANWNGPRGSRPIPSWYI